MDKKINLDYAAYLADEYVNNWVEDMLLEEFVAMQFDTCSAPEHDTIEAFASSDDAVTAYTRFINENIFSTCK